MSPTTTASRKSGNWKLRRDHNGGKIRRRQARPREIAHLPRRAFRVITAPHAPLHTRPKSLRHPKAIPPPFYIPRTFDGTFLIFRHQHLRSLPLQCQNQAWGTRLHNPGIFLPCRQYTLRTYLFCPLSHVIVSIRRAIRLAQLGGTSFKNPCQWDRYQTTFSVFVTSLHLQFLHQHLCFK